MYKVKFSVPPYRDAWENCKAEYRKQVPNGRIFRLEQFVDMLNSINAIDLPDQFNCINFKTEEDAVVFLLKWG